MKYTAVIRTLGTAGNKYQRLLDSLKSQTIPPEAILVYLAKEYPIPKETIGIEQYILVDKGMLSQRALQYEEVSTEYILFLDDDLEFPPDTVSNMFNLLEKYHADVIAPDVFRNSGRPLLTEALMTLSGRMRPRYGDSCWGYKVMTTAGYSYNKKPQKDVYISQSNSGACFLCKKNDFLRINLRDELWVDDMPYPLGEDQVMYYKMYCLGFKQLTWYSHHLVHLDGGGNMTSEKERMRLYGDIYFKVVFWHRFLYMPEKSCLKRILLLISICYYILFTLLISVLKLRVKVFKAKWRALKDAIIFIKSSSYRSLPIIYKVNE